MIEENELHQIKRVMTFLNRAPEPVVDEFIRYGYSATIPAGQEIFMVGDRANAIALLINGVVRVYITGETGREITLYRFGSGESCVLTANAILNEQEFPAIALVEKTSKAIMVPEANFRDWVRRYDAWREFLFNLLSRRLMTMMAVINEVVFQRMDQRIAAYLYQRGTNLNPVRATHQEIAYELGSSREVISRLIESFKDEGMVRTRRGAVEILDFNALHELMVM